MVSTTDTIMTNTWLKATWEDFLAVADIADTRDDLKKTSFYYDAGHMRIETMPTGFSHSRSHGLISSAITLYGTLKDLDLILLENGSFRKAGDQECQPDIALYIGETLPSIPESNQPIDVDQYGPPSLAIEISASSLSDDLGQKRLLYERFNVLEYWVVNVNAVQLLAFSIFERGSRSISISDVLPGLEIALIEAALQKVQTENTAAVNRWLIKQFSE